MADTKLNIIINATDKASGPIRGISGSLGKLGSLAGKTVAVGIGATAAAVGALGIGLGKLAIDSAPVEGIRNSFNALTKDFEGGSAAMLSAMQNASSGMISNTDLMRIWTESSQLMGVELAQNYQKVLNI